MSHSLVDIKWLPAIFDSLQMTFGLEWTARAALHSVGKIHWRP